MKFLGRQDELRKIRDLKAKPSPSFLVIKGRRRIGKTRLVKEIAKDFDSFIAIEGAIPQKKVTRKAEKNSYQLKIFSEQFTANFGVSVVFADWYSAFKGLAQFLPRDKSLLIFLDEISWMADGAVEEFKSALKHFWDHQFTENSDSMLAIAGSVSSWIEEHIVENTGFYGRESLVINLPPLDLKSAVQFWGSDRHISANEIFKLLSVTGTIPKYLEQINPTQDAEQNIHAMCFDKSGYLFNEYPNIFQNIFGVKSKTYEKICRFLAFKRAATLADIKKGIKNRSGDITQYLEDLSHSGFVRKQAAWNFKTHASKPNAYHYTLCDPYVRFYLIYVEPRRDRILNDTFQYQTLESYANWSSIAGLQFEEFIKQNMNLLFSDLGIHKSSVENYGSYLVKPSPRHAGTQIDMLIQTNSSLYVCEAKFRKKINSDTKAQIKEKIDILGKLPGTKHLSIRPVLIFVGELSDPLKRDDYFIKIDASRWV